MATRTSPSNPELENDPGRDEYERLVRRYNPDAKDNRPAGNPTDPRDHDVAAGDPSDPRGSISASEIKDREEVGGGRVGRGYRKSAGNSNKPLWARLTRRQKILGIGGGMAGGGIIAILIFLMPVLRLESYMSTINQRVFAASSYAVSQRIEHLFDRYLINRVLQMQRCGNRVTADCRADYTKMGEAGALFNAWRDAKIESKLFDRYGFEVQSYKNPVSGEERFKIIDKKGTFGKPGSELTVKNGELSLGKVEGGPRIFGQEWNKFLREQTKWYQILQRKSIRKYLVRKHGVKFWCFWACKTKDSIDNSRLSAKTKLKYKLIERIIYPFSAKYGLIMECITSGNPDRCSPDNLDKKGLDRSTLSDQDLEDLKKFEKNPNYKLSQYLFEKLLLKLGVDQATAKGVVSAIPFAGWIYFGLSALDGAEQTKKFIESGALSKIAAEVTSSQYVEYYTAMRTANDELKDGALKSDEVGAMMDDFGGKMPAEQSLVYQAYSGGGSNKSVASLFGIGKVFAATATDGSSQDQYVCMNGKPIPQGELVCPEKTLNNRTFGIEKFFKDSNIGDLLKPYESCYLGRPVFGKCIGFRPSTEVHLGLGGVNWLINNTLGALLSAAFSTMKAIPGLNYLMSQVEKVGTWFLNYIFNQAFPLPVHPDSVGREKYDGLEAGGEVVASEFNKGGYTDDGQSYGLGGKLLTKQQQSDVNAAYLDQENYDYAHSSIFAKLTNLDYPGSVANRFIAAMPASFTQLMQGVGSMFMHPFSGLTLPGAPVFAANPTDINAFGVPRFGYAINDPAFNADPSIYTPEYCQQAEKKWQDSAIQNPVTGITEYSTTNPCLLEEVSVEAASSVFTNNLSLDDGNQAPTTTTTAGNTIDMSNIFSDSTNVACATGTKDLGIQDGYYNGKQVKIRICAISQIPSSSQESNGGFGVVGANGGLVVNSRASGAVLAMALAAKADGVSLAANSGFRTMEHQQSLCPCDGVTVARPGYSNHQMGLAIDFGGGLTSSPGPVPSNQFWDWLSANAAKFGFKNYPREAWHWSVTGN